jgi:hypothetical protein
MMRLRFENINILVGYVQVTPKNNGLLLFQLIDEPMKVGVPLLCAIRVTLEVLSSIGCIDMDNVEFGKFKGYNPAFLAVLMVFGMDIILN